MTYSSRDGGSAEHLERSAIVSDGIYGKPTLSWKQCSRPLTPWSFELDPTAMTNLSSESSAKFFRPRQTLTRNIASLSISNLDFNQPLTHVEVNSSTHQVVTAHASDELAQRFDERSRLNCTYTGRWEEGSERKVGLGRDEGYVVLRWWKGREEGDGL